MTSSQDDCSDSLDHDYGSSKSSRAPKGKVYLDRLAVQRAKGLVQDVAFNEYDQPIGAMGAELQSYIGVLARRHVKVSYEEWKDVPKEVLNTIWESVKLAYNVHESWKKKCLASANAKWRQWKSKLNTKHIVPHEDKPSMLCDPPPLSGIREEDWKSFVIHCMSTKFKSKSKALKELRRKNIYPHHVSRKGYAGLREEMRSELTGDAEVDRAILWKKARVNKKGEFDGEQLSQTANKIDKFVQQKKEGVFCKSGQNDDILSQALEKPDHSGRARGVGSLVTPTAYFNKGQDKRTGIDMQEVKLEFEKQLVEMKAKMMVEMDAKMLEFKDLMLKKDNGGNDVEGKDSCSIKKPNVEYCYDSNNVEEIHCDNVVQVVKQQKKLKRGTLQPMKLNKPELPRPLRMLYMSSRHDLGDGVSIQIQMDDNVFGDEHINYIFLDDIQNMCDLKPISASCVCTYIWHLYKECKSVDLLDRFRFVNPYAISHNPKVDQTTKSSIIGKRLIGTRDKQLILMPCNVGYVRNINM